MRRGEKAKRATAAAVRRTRKLSIIAGLAVLAVGAALTAILAMAFDCLNLVYATGRGKASFCFDRHYSSGL